MTYFLLIRYSSKHPLAKKSPWASVTWTTLYQKLLEELFPVSFLIHFSFLSISKICHLSVSLYIFKKKFFFVFSCSWPLNMCFYTVIKGLSSLDLKNFSFKFCLHIVFSSFIIDYVRRKEREKYFLFFKKQKSV